MPRSVAAALSALAILFATAGAGIAAPDYPTRTVTLVVPFPPGGGVDAMARVVAAKLSEAMRQQFVVDNRAGAGGTIGTRAVAQAAPDGYTLLLGHTGTISINPSLYAHAGYDPRKDFAPVGLVASMPVAAARSRSRGWRTARRTRSPFAPMTRSSRLVFAPTPRESATTSVTVACSPYALRALLRR